MKLEDNIRFAKDQAVDMIWKQANLEGIAVTFPQTAEIISGRSVSGLTVDEVYAINNLKHAWQTLFEHILDPFDLEFIKLMNYKVGEGGVVPYAGDLRVGIVGVGGTDYIPPVPNEIEVVKAISALAQIEDPVTRALDILCYIARTQVFNNGNKRTAFLAANKIIIEAGQGVLMVPNSKQEEFYDKLIAFYESNDNSELVRFLKETSHNNPELTNGGPHFAPYPPKVELPEKVAESIEAINQSIEGSLLPTPVTRKKDSSISGVGR